MPGVVSLPHGWGHGAKGANLPVAARYSGVNVNVLTDELDVEPVSGTAVLNGVPVEISALDGAEHRPAAVAAGDVGGIAHSSDG
jgi:hypothetical protein